MLSARLHRHTSRRLSAVQVLQRHALSTIARFAFIDGEPVDAPDPGLLTVFYTDPSDSVSSRYCWALLAGEGDRTALSNVILATVAEFQAFLSLQDEAVKRGADNPLSLVAQRHVIGPAAATTALEDEIGQVCDDAEEAADVLRQIRWARLSKR